MLPGSAYVPAASPRAISAVLAGKPCFRRDAEHRTRGRVRSPRTILLSRFMLTDCATTPTARLHISLGNARG